jgi:histidine triad (HIT) family protein
MSCIICDLSARRAPASFVYESDEVFAVMTLEQPNPYKLMVCPRAHVESVYDLTDAQAAAVFTATVRIARAVRDASHCGGLNLVQSNGRAAGQDVPHFHLHIVPRHHGDGVRLEWDNTPLARDTLERFAHEIRAKLVSLVSYSAEEG